MILWINVMVTYDQIEGFHMDIMFFHNSDFYRQHFKAIKHDFR